MNPLAIINPHSGGGRTGQRVERIEQALRGAVGALDIALTERPRHATRLARQAAIDARPTVIAVGGDGTLHEVVNGLMQARADGDGGNPLLGIVGQGTGGDFRKTLGMSAELEGFCRALRSERTRALDVGRFDYATERGGREQAYFVNILSVGLGGLVDRYVARASRALGGTAAYFGATLRGLLASRVGELECRLYEDGKPRTVLLESRSVAICNGRFFGSGMEVAPMARPDDGCFDVVAMGAGSRIGFARSSLSIYSGRHIHNPEVSVYRCQRIEMELRNREIRDRFPLDVDGEPFGLLPLDAEVIPGALEVLVA